jgi:Trypsin-co-occurring domain 2
MAKIGTRARMGGAVSAALLSLACAGATKTPAPASGEGAELAAVVDAIQQALREAQARPVSGFPPLKSVTVKLQTEASRSAGGEIAVYVFSLESRYTAETASTLELKMRPPEGAPPRGLSPSGELRDALARAIHLAQLGAAKAAEGDPPFAITEVAIDLKFAVEATGAAGAKVALVPLGAEAAGRINRNQVHTVNLVFAKRDGVAGASGEEQP